MHGTMQGHSYPNLCNHNADKGLKVRESTLAQVDSVIGRLSLLKLSGYVLSFARRS
jgi:hypothetical protein